MSRSPISLLICCFMAAALFAATSGVANAKQCVWNKSGFVLKVLWYTPSNAIIYSKNRKTGKVHYKIRKTTKWVQKDIIPSFQGRCTRGRRAKATLGAVLEVVGGKLGSDATKATVDVVAAGAGAAGCVETAMTTCSVSAGLATGAAMGINAAIPDGKDLIRVMIPPKTRYVDVWGTIWNPQVGLGGPIH